MKSLYAKGNSQTRFHDEIVSDFRQNLMSKSQLYQWRIQGGKGLNTAERAPAVPDFVVSDKHLSVP